MDNYFGRLLVEKQELSVKLNKLELFLRTKVYKNLEEEKPEIFQLLAEQAGAMRVYLGILEQRIFVEKRYAIKERAFNLCNQTMLEKAKERIITDDCVESVVQEMIQQQGEETIAFHAEELYKLSAIDWADIIRNLKQIFTEETEECSKDSWKTF